MPPKNQGSRKPARTSAEPTRNAGQGHDKCPGPTGRTRKQAGPKPLSSTMSLAFAARGGPPWSGSRMAGAHSRGGLARLRVGRSTTGASGPPGPAAIAGSGGGKALCRRELRRGRRRKRHVAAARGTVTKASPVTVEEIRFIARSARSRPCTGMSARGSRSCVRSPGFCVRCTGYCVLGRFFASFGRVSASWRPASRCNSVTILASE